MLFKIWNILNCIFEILCFRFILIDAITIHVVTNHSVRKNHLYSRSLNWRSFSTFYLFREIFNIYDIIIQEQVDICYKRSSIRAYTYVDCLLKTWLIFKTEVPIWYLFIKLRLYIPKAWIDFKCFSLNESFIFLIAFNPNVNNNLTKDTRINIWYARLIIQINYMTSETVISLNSSRKLFFELFDPFALSFCFVFI